MFADVLSSVDSLLIFFVEAVGVACGTCVLIGVIVWAVFYLIQAFSDITKT